MYHRSFIAVDGAHARETGIQKLGRGVFSLKFEKKEGLHHQSERRSQKFIPVIQNCRFCGDSGCNFIHLILNFSLGPRILVLMKPQILHSRSSL